VAASKVNLRALNGILMRSQPFRGSVQNRAAKAESHKITGSRKVGNTHWEGGIRVRIPPFLFSNSALHHESQETLEEPMFWLVFTVVGILLCTGLVTAFWQLACFLTRKLLGIPKYPPFYEAELQQLPYYLDDRIPPPNA
jgi:hypothetical protein